ncbi:MAG: ribosome maturation factor RimP [Lachnospiraceae bacterium]|nr:ribosome maturation factor RimP [Lachnospiraceae bacterium]
MAKKESYEQIATELALKVTEPLGLELVDVEYVKEGGEYYLRIYIDKEGGVKIDDCEAASRKISDLLDEADPISDAYILEVSSPGLFRVLKKDKDFERNIGKTVLAKLFKAADGEKQLRGELEGFDATELTIKIGDKSISIPRDNVAKISLDPDL